MTTSSTSGPRSASNRRPTVAEWRERVARFANAWPDLVARRELRLRTDSKFVLPPAAVADLLGAIPDHYAAIDAGGQPFASYRTVYFDTSELELFHAHRRGRRVRHKVRIRHYADRCVTSLEVKTRRSELQTIKVWRARAWGDEDLTAEDQAFVSLLAGTRHEVMPQASTRFRRLTLLGLEHHERVTVDLDLEVSAGDRGRRRSLDGLAIVEVKQWPFRRSTPVMTALREAGFRPGWASKYCAAIAFTRPDVRVHELLPGLRVLEQGAA